MVHNIIKKYLTLDNLDTLFTLLFSSGLLLAADFSNRLSILKARILASVKSEAEDISLTMSSAHPEQLVGMVSTVRSTAIAIDAARFMLTVADLI